MPIRDWSTLSTSNASASAGINWAEGQAPSTVNDSARQMMAEVATWLRDGSWIEFADQSHTVVNSTSTKIEGRNLEAYYPANRRVRAIVGASTTFGRITDSTFSTDTVITYAWDSGSLSAAAYRISVALADPDAEGPAIAPLKTSGPVIADAVAFYDSSLSSSLVPAQKVRALANGTGMVAGSVPVYDSSLSVSFRAASALGGISEATKAEMEDASLSTVAASPRNTVWHPGVAKVWCKFNGLNTLSVVTAFNISSVTDGGLGTYTANYDKSFSTGDYAVNITTTTNVLGAVGQVNNPTVSSLSLNVFDAGTSPATLADTYVFISCFGARQ